MDLGYLILRNATRLTCLKLLLPLFLLTHHHTRIMFTLSSPNTLPPVCCNSQVLTPILLGKIEFTRYFHPSFTWYNNGPKTSIILLPLQPSGVITPCSEIMPYDMVQAGRQKPMCHGKHRQAGFTGKLHIRRVSRPGQLWKLWKLVGLSGHG